MKPIAATLLKNPPLPAVQDFYRLRREGIEFIEHAGSARWTDYNVHDPGITILEALCYAITDLGYRIGWDIEDILSPRIAPAAPLPPYPDQAFFTAREILPVNPVTPDDFRRLLIDLESVRNAWVLCKECACEASYYAWCEKDALVLGYTPPADVALAPVTVSPRGLYEALLELESDPELGDLHDRKIELRHVFFDSAGPHTILMELRFPDIAVTNSDQWQLFLASDAAFDSEAGFHLTLTRLGANKKFDVLTDPSLATDAQRDAYLRNQWRNVLYASFEIEIAASGEKLAIENAALRLFSDVATKNLATAQALKDTLIDRRASGFIRRYRRKALLARAAVQSAKATLQSHRNLDEDYCIVSTVGVDEVAVCADVEVKPDADIERVQARIWFEIEQYFNPPIRFHTLQELRDAGTAVEDIFDGPELQSGFIKAADLEAASLKSVLRVSDILNRLMDIDGVIAVNQLLLTRYDSEGNLVRGTADPTWVDGQPDFDPNKVSASWLLFIGSRHQPRLYLNQSRFLFYKNGLPFLPRMDEAMDTLNQLRGDAERPKNPGAARDLSIPRGTFRNPEDYSPVQYSFPLAYGIGPHGLPSNASTARRAQALQLKAYLMVFEQLLGNAHAQLAHTADLFSLDPSVARTYFVRLFDDEQIKGLGALTDTATMTRAALEAMTESEPEFYERRNRFLDHLLARFGEDFNEYALLLTNAAGENVAQPRLIEDKIAFLKRYPQISHDRAKAFDYTREPCSASNYPGIKKRILLLLGYPDLMFSWTIAPAVAGSYSLSFRLLDTNARLLLEGSLTIAATSDAQAVQAAYRAIIGHMVRADAWTIVAEDGKFRLKVQDQSATSPGVHPRLFDTQADAAAMRDQLMAWSANERLIVVEHLLLRPKFPGDALYPACCDGACSTCGSEDPYSFRLTFVMPGWVAQYTSNLDLRRFAERTIQQETPAHLLGKTCWVGNDGFVENPCDEVIGKLADLLTDAGLTAACECANAVYHAFSTVFMKWYGDRALDFIHADALAVLIGAEFAASIRSSDVACTADLDAARWADVQALMTAHFRDIALRGWQFERFENAWCKWLDANAAIDWTNENLLARVEATLAANLLDSSVPHAAVCNCAQSILTQYGATFFAWMQANLQEGNEFEHLTEFVPSAIALCTGMDFKEGTAEAIAGLLGERYASYKEVSYRLWVVVSLLANLRSTWPGATLHDCDDGSDHNPVRLDNTALGNYPLRTSVT
jgi:hypothetical protein